MKNDSNKEPKKNSGLFVACWFLALILLLILFFVKKDDITGNLKKTDFFGKVFGSTPEFVKNHQNSDSEKNAEQTYEFDLLGKNSNSSQNNSDNSKIEYQEATGSENIKMNKEAAEGNVVVLAPNQDDIQNNSNQKDEITKTQNKQTSESNKKSLENTKNSATSSAVSSTREVILYFVAINSDGSISRKQVKRSLPRTDSPLTNAINALLSGPVPNESTKNCTTLIPEGTKLLGASVKDGVATLNFNESFEFNPMGVEGYIGQLTQIIYTATEFSTVKSVQFLIEGEKRDYLGIESGQWIGSPLSRSSL